MLATNWASFDTQLLANSFEQRGITTSSIDDLHVQLGTFVSISKFLDMAEQADEEEVETLFRYYE